MGTPNTVYFECPSCKNKLQVQTIGLCEHLKIEKMCECSVEDFIGKEILCDGCNFMIILEKHKGLKMVPFLRATIKKEESKL